MIYLGGSLRLVALARGCRREDRLVNSDWTVWSIRPVDGPWSRVHAWPVRTLGSPQSNVERRDQRPRARACSGASLSRGGGALQSGLDGDGRMVRRPRVAGPISRNGSGRSRSVGAACAIASRPSPFQPDLDGPLRGERRMTVRSTRPMLLAHSRRDRLVRRLALRGLLSLAIAELIVLASAGVPMVVSGVSM